MTIRSKNIPLGDKWKAKALSKPQVRKNYNELALEYSILNELLKARISAGLTQEQLAAKIGRKQSSIARFERTLSKMDSSVSLSFLRDYAHACGKKVKISFDNLL